MSSRPNGVAQPERCGIRTEPERASVPSSGLASGKWAFVLTRTVDLLSVAWDTSRLPPGTLNQVFFGDVPEYVVPSVTETSEQELVASLLADARVLGLIVTSLGLDPPVRHAQRVTEPFTSPSQKPGDVDVLLAAVGQPQHAVAMEAKWVKVRSEGEGRQRVNKLNAVGRAGDQTEGLLALGFARAYLMLLAVVDDRQDRRTNFLFRGTTNETFQKIIDFAEESTIPADAGILYVELSQPLAKHVGEAGMVSIGVLRQATQREQVGELTQRVLSYLQAAGLPR